MKHLERLTRSLNQSLARQATPRPARLPDSDCEAVGRRRCLQVTGNVRHTLWRKCPADSFAPHRASGAAEAWRGRNPTGDEPKFAAIRRSVVESASEDGQFRYLHLEQQT